MPSRSSPPAPPARDAPGPSIAKVSNAAPPVSAAGRNSAPPPRAGGTTVDLPQPSDAATGDPPAHNSQLAAGTSRSSDGGGGPSEFREFSGASQADPPTGAITPGSSSAAAGDGEYGEDGSPLGISGVWSSTKGPPPAASLQGPKRASVGAAAVEDSRVLHFAEVGMQPAAAGAFNRVAAAAPSATGGSVAAAAAAEEEAVDDAAARMEGDDDAGEEAEAAPQQEYYGTDLGEKRARHAADELRELLGGKEGIARAGVVRLPRVPQLPAAPPPRPPSVAF